jgi:hypothetical protein
MVITINCSQIVHSFCFELKSMLLLFFIYLFRIHLSDRCRLSRKKICLMHDREIFRSTSNIKYNSLGIFNCSIRALVGLDTCTCRHHSRPNKQYPIVWLDFENKKAKDRIESDLNIAVFNQTFILLLVVVLVSSSSVLLVIMPVLVVVDVPAPINQCCCVEV